MPKGPAKLGYFVSKDQTIQNADNVCVLVVHYNFEKTKNETWIRRGDAKDVKNLKRTFGENRNCNFQSILSPEKGELLELLSDQEKLLRLFGSSDVPSVFVLYILSHGDRDGKIFTDHFKDDVPASAEDRARIGDPKEFFVSFTTTEIFESLKKLTGFEECLKFINFGPCRGELADVIFVPKYENFENENSCRITYSPLSRNTVVFFSTVETTKAKRNQSGSTFASLTCQVLNSLEEDESFINVLASIQYESHKNVDMMENKYTGQTPEVKMFSQDRGFVISKSPKTYSASSTSDALGIKIKKKLEFYSWKSSSGENLRRRLAILFSAEPNDQLKEIKRALSQNLDFETSKRMLSGKPWTSINKDSWCDSNIGCIFLIFFGRLSENKDMNEVCVQVDGQETAVSEILREFIGPKNDQWIGKPKILFLINQETSSSDFIGTAQPKMKISATNHSGWLVQVLHNKDDLEKLIDIFNGQELKKEKSLQQLLARLLISESKENKDLLISTLQYPLNFPDWPSSFVQLSFSVTKSQKNKEYDVSFDSLVKKSAKEKQIWLLSSVAGTGKTTVLREMAFQLGKLNPELKILRVSLPRVLFSSLDWNTTEIELLANVTHNSQKEIIKRIEKKQCVVILDGFDEIPRPENQEKVLKVIEALEKKQISVWVGTRPHAAETIKNRIPRAVLVKINPLDEEQQIEFLKLETGKSREECERFIENFKSKDILGNPLHLSLVAKYGAEGNLYQIYDKVVRHKVEIHLQDREGYDKNNLAKFAENIANAMGDLRQLASYHIGGVALPDYTKDDLDKNNYYGIASFQNNKVFFIHQTFAEFLAAQHFLREIENCGDCDIQTRTANFFFKQSSSWCIKFVVLFYSTYEEKIEEHKASILSVMKLNPDRFLELIVYSGCINIFKMIYQNIAFSNNREGNFISVAKDKTLLVKAIQGAEEIAIMLLEMDFIERDEELLTILPCLLNSVAERNACLFFEKLRTKYLRLPEMIHSRRFLIDAGVIAAGRNHGEILELLLKSGVDVDFVKRWGQIEKRFFVEKEFGNALRCSISFEALKCVEILLKHGAKLAIDGDGVKWDPLMLAVKENNLDLVKYLLEENISGLQRNKETLEINEVKSDLNAFHFAIREGRKEIAKFLIENCPSLKNVENGNERSPLKILAKNGNFEMCQWLVDEEGENVNTLRPRGKPRDWSLDDNVFMDHFLILQKSDVNMTDKRGKTALHCAAEYGYLKRVQELIDSGANIRAVDKNGWNAFHFSCKSTSKHSEYVIRIFHMIDSQLFEEKTKSGESGIHILLKFDSLCSNNIFAKEVMRFLVEEIGVDVKAMDNNGCTALRIAVDKRYDDFVDYLITKDIDLEVKNYCGRTCLHFAAERGDLEALQTWIDLGGDLDVVDNEGSTALHLASEKGHLQFVEKLLTCAAEEAKNSYIGKGSVGSKLEENERVNRFDDKGRTPLHLAAESGNVDLVKLLLQNNADLTQTDLKGKNAIHFAIRNERMLRFLNEKNGSLVKQRRKDGDTTLHLAMETISDVTEEIALWIIGQVDDTVLNAKSYIFGKTPLLLACEEGCWRVAELLLSRNVEVNVSNNMWGKTAMHYAAENGNLDLVKLLHEKGADLTLTDDEGMNALHHAAENGNLSLVKLLHEKGADLTLTDDEGMNALHHAMKDFELFSFLHEKNGALMKQRLKNGDTTLHVAIRSWFTSTDNILWLLEQFENDLNATNCEGETPLMLAFMKNKWKFAKILLRKGVDIHVKDKKGRTALHYAGFRELFRDKLEATIAFDLVQELCKRGLDLALKDNDGMNAFHHAMGDYDMALYIHELNGDLVKQRLNNGDTTLHLAIKLYKRNKNDDVLNWLVEQCENDLNVRNNEGETPFLLACKENEEIYAKILLEKGVDIHVKDQRGRTALHYAVQLDEYYDLEDSAFDLVEELRKRGADFALTDHDGKNAFHHAIINRDKTLFMRYLKGYSVKEQLNNGDTLLHVAIKVYQHNTDDKFLLWLVEQDLVDLNATNSLNETPLILACKKWKQNWKIVELLLSKNVNVILKDIEGKCARDYIDESCPTRLLRRFDELEEASPSKKCE